jgi:hypothetical protein
MIRTPVSTRTATAAWPRAGAPDFTFTVHSHGGQALGIGITEFDWALQVESRRGLVSVESFRSDADLPGEPIGVFRYSIDDHKLREFQELAAASGLGQLRPAMAGHPGYTERSYTFVQPPQAAVRELINNSDEATNARIAPLRNRINSMMAASFAHPERAARVGLRHSRLPAGDTFEITVTNIGIEKVCFADPRSVPATGPLQRAAVMVAEFAPTPAGAAPPFLDWQAVPLEPLQAAPSAQALVVLDRGAEWTATVPRWKRLAGRRYLAYFTLANYAGEAMVDGVYRIRGRADSRRLVIEAQ